MVGLAVGLAPAIAEWIDAQADLVDCEALRSAFVEHDIGTDALPLLDQRDLEQMGITKIGQRAVLLARCRAFKPAGETSGNAMYQAEVKRTAKMIQQSEATMIGMGVHLLDILMDLQKDAASTKLDDFFSSLKEFWALLGLSVSLLLTMTFPYCMYDSLGTATEGDFAGIALMKYVFHALMMLSTCGSVITILIITSLYVHSVVICSTTEDRVWFLVKNNMNLPQNTMIAVSILPFVVALPLGVMVSGGWRLGIAGFAVLVAIAASYLAWLARLGITTKSRVKRTGKRKLEAMGINGGSVATHSRDGKGGNTKVAPSSSP
jgi:hypothetical protein